jgi:signal transduction histidine kinase
MLRMLELFGATESPTPTLTPERAGQIQAHAEEIDFAYIRENLDPLLRRTREGLDRVTRIIKSMRGFSRAAPAKRQEVYLPDLVGTCLEIIQGTLRKRSIQVEEDYDSPPKISCVFSDINQVVLNLLINACHAIEALPPAHPGKIRISVRSEPDEQILEVLDNGCGIPPEVREHLFDPFFTTKDVDQGTGLGLWICHNVVTAHGGRLEVISQPGAGTAFRMFLPSHVSADAH